MEVLGRNAASHGGVREVCLGVMVPLQREGETGRLGRGWRQEGHPAALGEILAVQMVARI